MHLTRKTLAFGLTLIVALLAVLTSAWALDPGKDGFYYTGDGVRVKTVAFINVKVYSIAHAMKELPPTKSKQAVIDIDTDKRITWKMLRDVDAEKIQNAIREGFQMNGYSDAGKIASFVGAFKNDLKEGNYVYIKYDSASKTTSVNVQGGGSASINSVEFMKGVWSLWFGKIDQPSLGDQLISRIP
jgi:hypothetical protein